MAIYLCCLIAVCAVRRLVVYWMVVALALIRYLGCLCLIYCVDDCFMHSGFRCFTTGGCGFDG